MKLVALLVLVFFMLIGSSAVHGDSVSAQEGVDCSLTLTTPFKTYDNHHWVIAGKAHIGAELGCASVRITQEIIYVSGDSEVLAAKAPLAQFGYSKAHYQTIWGDLPFCAGPTDHGDFIQRLHVEAGDGSAFWDIDSEVHTVAMNC